MSGKSIREMSDEEFSNFLILCALSELDEETKDLISKETTRRWGVGSFGREPETGG